MSTTQTPEKPKHEYDQVNNSNPSPSSSQDQLPSEESCSILDLINYSKGNQKFQKRLFLGFCLAQVLLGMVTVSLIFFFYSVSFTCKTNSNGILASITNYLLALLILKNTTIAHLLMPARISWDTPSRVRDTL